MHPAISDSSRGLIFYWNVDGHVGINGTNTFEDVLFVQWCFYKTAQWTQVSPELRAIYRNTLVTGECSGRDGDPLITSIKAMQRGGSGGPVDGRVSPATKGITYSFHGDRHRFLIFRLNAALRALHPEQYPRIDLMPQFIWRIKDKAIAPFIDGP